MIATDDPRLVALRRRREASPSGPHHYHVIDAPRSVTVRVGRQVVARSERAVVLKEVGQTVYDPVYYVPPDDVHSALVLLDAPRTVCPVKGEALYYALGDAPGWVAWSYPDPVPYADAIAGLVAFDASRVTVEVQVPATPYAPPVSA